MYNITREQAWETLNLSTRSIDRYIRSWKLRSKKEWKIVYINNDDVNNFLWNSNNKQEIIIKEEIKNSQEKENISISKNNNNLWVIFDKLRFEIKLKDEEIKELSVKIWKMQEVVKNSISMIEYKKNQFLLEESKNSLNQEVDNLKKEIISKNNTLNEEKKLNLMLIVTTIILFLWLIIVFLVKV